MRLAHVRRPRSLSLQLELKTGETYRGTLVEAEDNWNSQLKDIVVTGRVRRREQSVAVGTPRVGLVPSLAAQPARWAVFSPF